MAESGRGRRWSRIFRPDARSEVEEELEFHLEQRVRDNIARGMTADAARAAAHARVGDLNEVRSQCIDLLTAERRSESRREWVKFSVLDFKLGLRMLGRYPGLTLVGGLAIAFAIWVGASTFELINQFVDPKLPLPDADRIVAIRNRDLQSRDVAQSSAQDFTRWREETKSVTDIGAYYSFNRNLTVGENSPVPIHGAAISAAAFRVARLAPVVGRGLVDADEQPGAPGVIVISHRAWQNRFDGDSNVVGKTVRLGSDPVTVVGVMPENFGFPASQSTWIPLRLNPNEMPGAGPPVRVFGRLAAGASLEQAKAELLAAGQRAQREYRNTREHLRAEVVPFGKSLADHFSSTDVMLIRSINLFLIMLLALVSANVALLVFARAAARESEIAVRNALGASRSRIVTQLFAEALVLVGCGAALGLAAAGYGLRFVIRATQSGLLQQVGQLDFWRDWRLSPATAFYAVALTLLGALIVGVVPALRVTSGLQARLREAGAGGGGLKFGGLWTAVIVIQVALTLAFPATGYFTRQISRGEQSTVVGFRDDEFLVARLDRDRAKKSADERFRADYHEIERRLLSEPGVVAVTFGEQLPRMGHPQRIIQVDELEAAQPDSSNWITTAAVDLKFFDAFEASIVAGRAFHSADLSSAEGAVIVNEGFVRRILGGRNAVGRRIRVISREAAARGAPDEDAGPWQVIVGVVSDLETRPTHAGSVHPRIARVYRPVGPEQAQPLQMAIHVKGAEPMTLLPRLREIAASVDIDLRVNQTGVLSDIRYDADPFVAFGLRMVILVSTVALVLSLAGIYSVMSFTVTRRRREIGVRVALGADRRRLILSVFARPLTQLTLGIVAGTALVIVLSLIAYDQTLSFRGATLVAAYSIVMMGVCMLACIVPTRRALRVDPMYSLRAES